NFINYWGNTGTGNYSGLITTLRHTFSHNFQLEAQYAWAKAMDENSGPFTRDPYPYNSHAAYGRSDYNVANGFKIFGLWQPVIFSGSHGWLEKVAGGWSLSGILNVHSGFPVNPVYNVATSGGLYYNGSGYTQLRPGGLVAGYGKSTGNKNFQQSTNPNYGGDATRYFTGPAYVDGPAFPAVALSALPGIQRNSLTGPGYNDLDGTVSKAFGLPKMPVLGESAKIELRADSFNLFNKTNIDTASIDNTVGSAALDGTISSNSDFGVAGKALGSRTVQLQARFSF
ncbi:MAG: hypothetical protein QOK38_1369, partial [Acidobacteriaceae bacterium]|nr:hypothetical protein [Acidobacteriaceae bacterium]